MVDLFFCCIFVLKQKEMARAHNFIDREEQNSAYTNDYYGFIEGFRANKKLTDKIILDSLNKYKSSLANEQRVKLTKIVNYEKVKLLESQIEVLLEIQNKLKL